METETPLWLDDCLAQVEDFRNDPNLQPGINKIRAVAALFDEGDQRLLFAKLAGFEDISAFAGASVNAAWKELEKDQQVRVTVDQLMWLVVGMHLDAGEHTLKELFGVPSVVTSNQNRFLQESLPVNAAKAVSHNP